MQTRILPTKPEEADKQFWRQCKCGQGQFLVPLTTDGAISRPVKSRIGKGQPLIVVAGPEESNYERGLKMASCNDERRWVKRWRKGSHCIVITSFLLLHPSYQDEESKLKLLSCFNFFLKNTNSIYVGTGQFVQQK